MRLGVLVAILCSGAVALEIFVDSKHGDDENDGLSLSRTIASLNKAQLLVKQALASGVTDDLFVTLLPGRHAAPLHLTHEHRTRKGQRVVWRAQVSGTAVVDGGVAISGPWTPVHGEIGLYSAPVPSALAGNNARQLYVNGVRAQRSSVAVTGGMLTRVGTTGFTYKGPTQNWANPADVEMVFTGVGSGWTEPRCTAASISGSMITMKQPCFQNAVNKPFGQGVSIPKTIENVRSAVKSPGTWYYDRAGGAILYHPRPGEDIHKAQVFAPLEEVLTSGIGTSGQYFTGITFEHGSWLRPSQNDGFVDIQTAVCITGTNWTVPGDSWTTTPGNLYFWNSTNIVFTNCTFQHLGAFGVSFAGGSNEVFVANSTFTDTSAGAISLGQLDDYANKDNMTWNQQFEIFNNYIHDVSVEYHGSAAIFAGYIAHTVISQNTIKNLPYTGISMGWGWGREISYANDNHIMGNEISFVVMMLFDGGAIYTLGPQPLSTVANNYCHDQQTQTGVLYHDNGSGYFRTFENVVDNSPVPHWLFLNPPDESSHDGLHYQPPNWASYNYVRNAQPVGNNCNPTANCTVLDTTTIPPGGAWPAGAQAIISLAGHHW